MQQFRPRMGLLAWVPRQPIVFGAVLSSMMFPSKAHYHEILFFEEGLTVKISENSPPRAVLEDELIVPLETLPKKALIAEKGKSVLVAGVEELEPSRLVTKISFERFSEIQTKPVVLKTLTVTKPTIVTPVEEKAEEKPEPSVTIFAQASARDVIQNQVAKQVDGALVAPAWGQAFKDEVKRAPASQEHGDGQSTPRNVPRTNEAPDDTGIASTTTPDRNPAAGGVGAASVAAYSGPLVIEGDILLENGLALTDEGKIEVFQDVLGERVSSADVNPRKGRYQMYVQNANQGILVAQVVNKDGRVLGRVKQALGEIRVVGDSKQRKAEADVVISPLPAGIVARVSSVYTPTVGEKNLEVDAAGIQTTYKTDRRGKIHEGSVLHGSQVILSTSKENHWNSLILSSNKNENEMSLYPNSMIQAMANLLEVNIDTKEDAIVWGRVEREGKPLLGATAEITSSEAVGPIYFNSLMLPDAQMKATGENGIFAFLKVSQGMQQVRAKTAEGKQLPGRMTVAESGAVSEVKVEAEKKIKAKAVLYDGFSGQAQSGEISFVGTDRSATVTNGILGMQFNGGDDWLVLEAEAGHDYLSVRQVFNREEGTLKFPMVQKNWFNTVVNNRKINLVPSTGTVVGYIPEPDFEVLLPESSLAEIIYFDGNGQTLGKDEMSRAGFIVVNLEPGLQILQIASRKQKGVWLRAVFSDATKTSLVTVQD